MVNEVTLIGHLGGDPEVHYTPSGKPVCKFSLATTEKWTGADGEKREETQWHRVQAWGKLAEICSQYLHKGKQVYIQGKIRYGSYEKDGVKHYTTDIVAETMKMLGGQRTQQQEPGGGSYTPPGPEEDIPF